MIALNTLVMAMEMQYKGFESGFQVGYPGYSRSSADTWPWAEDLFIVAEMIFGILFTAELVLKVAGLRLEFTWDSWNWIDTIIVVSWLASNLQFLEFPMDPLLLRLIRLARLLR